MPADALVTLKPGDDSLSSATWNSFVETTRVVRGVATGGGQAGNPMQATVIMVRNDSGSDRDRFDVLGLGGPVILPGDNLLSFLSRVCLAGVLPVEAVHSARFVILQEPVPTGMIGRAALAGVTYARVRGDSSLGCVDVTDADTAALTFRDGGSAQALVLCGDVLADGSGSGTGSGSGVPTGDQWAVVRIGNACVLPAGAEHGSGSGSGSGEGGPGEPCSFCTGPTPLTWTLPLSGFTGDMAAFNGTWTLRQAERGCTWYHADDRRGLWLDKLAGSFQLRLYTPDGDFEVQYEGGSDDCCADQVLSTYSVLTGSPTGGHPGSVSMHPACGTIPCPDPCGHCENGVAPAQWAFTSGASDWADDGACTWGQLNSQTVAADHRVSSCEWATVITPHGHRPRVFYTVGTGWVLEVFNVAGACTVQYKNATATDCCAPMAMTRLGSAAGTPATLVLTPSGGCCPAGGGGGGGGVSTTCFGGTTLGAAGTATVNDLGGCACWAGQSFPVVWDGTSWHGTKTVAGCGGVTMAFDLYPDPGGALHGHCLYGLVSFSDGSLGAGAVLAADPSSPPPAFVWTSNPFGGGAGAAGCTGPGGLTITVTGL